MDIELPIESYRELTVDADADVDHDQVALRDPHNGELFVVSRRAFAVSRVAKTELTSVAQGA